MGNLLPVFMDYRYFVNDIFMNCYVESKKILCTATHNEKAVYVANCFKGPRGGMIYVTWRKEGIWETDLRLEGIIKTVDCSLLGCDAL
jgi:hypothetical protein